MKSLVSPPDYDEIEVRHLSVSFRLYTLDLFLFHLFIHLSRIQSKDYDTTI
jgi:hypothetical protein